MLAYFIAMIRKITLFVLVLFAFNLAAQTKKGSLRKAKTYATKNDYEAAAKEYEQALKIDSNNYTANFEYGLLQTNYLNNPGEGGKYLLRAERLSKKDTASQIIYGLAEYYQYNNQYAKAIDYYHRTLAYIEDDEEGITLKTRINQSIADCEYAQQHPEASNRKKIRILNVGGGVNTLFPEYVPIVNKDETVMMFTSRRKDFSKTGLDDQDGEYFEDMFIAHRDKDGNFKGAHPFSSTDADVKDIPNSIKDHESVISISYNGDKFYTYKKNKIYVSDLKSNSWSTPKELDTSINADIYQNHLSISKDGKVIYFSSQKKGGIGGLDLYRSEIQADGKWSKAISLGDDINTKEDEGSPYISADGKTLYFSSKGHKGYGGYDILKTTFNGTTWSIPENMGLPFNSAGDDIYLTINEDETHGYLSSSRAGGYGDMDIYEITYLRAPFENFKIDSLGKLAFVAPDTVYIDQPSSFNLMAAKIPLSDIKTFTWSIKDSILSGNTKSSNYTFLKEGTYKLKAEAQTIDNNFLGYEKNIVVISKPIQVVTNTFGLEPVYFGFNKSTLDKQALEAMERNIKTLNIHTEAIIEISAYCDARGSTAYNQALSKKRAETIIKYLKEKTFDAKRIKQVEWFGEKDPVNKCTDEVPCTEDEYKLNRRAEFRLVR